MGWARNEGEEVGLVDRVDVCEAEGRREAEFVDEVGHYFWVVFYESFGQSVTFRLLQWLYV